MRPERRRHDPACDVQRNRYGYVRQSRRGRGRDKKAATIPDHEKPTLLGVLLDVYALGKLIEAIVKPNPAPIKEHARDIIPDTDITDAEFIDVIDDGDSKALVKGGIR